MTKEDKNKIAASNFFGDGSKRYVYFCRLDNGAIVDYDGNVWTITMPNGSYIAFGDSKDGIIKSINWIYQDGVLCLHTYASDEIVY
jgi:hypothetical protein